MRWYFHVFIRVHVILIKVFMLSGGKKSSMSTYYTTITATVIKSSQARHQQINIHCCRMKSSYIRRWQFFKNWQKAVLTAWQPWIFQSIHWVLKVFITPWGLRTSWTYRGPEILVAWVMFSACSNNKIFLSLTVYPAVGSWQSSWGTDQEKHTCHLKVMIKKAFSKSWECLNRTKEDIYASRYSQRICVNY